MVIEQWEYPLYNNSASTSDWIGQVKGRVIYACDIGNLFLESEGKIGFDHKPRNKNTFHKAVKKYKARFKDAWIDLSAK